MENKEPLSPHIQIYKWHISSLVSISHRITGIINIIAITFICLLASLLVFGQNSYEMINLFLVFRTKLQNENTERKSQNQKRKQKFFRRFRTFGTFF